MFVDRARSDGPHLTGEGADAAADEAGAGVRPGGRDDRSRRLRQARHNGQEQRQQPYGTRSKTVLTDGGPVETKAPRGTAGTFEPQIVRTRQRRLTGVDEMVLSLSAKGLTMRRYRLIRPRCTGGGVQADHHHDHG
ncbi:hypothetical protein GCM10014715_79400 [Streptomyces spiralis]|uniref:Mutator family transposase n=1 Tax=Streptomyces spiralis TaxID=66376 RepID=A0A919E4M7_9ACTN|nr:hypothetical protein GCM10014715_79400 [Streptomyces spiralis]